MLLFSVGLFWRMTLVNPCGNSTTFIGSVYHKYISLTKTKYLYCVGYRIMHRGGAYLFSLVEINLASGSVSLNERGKGDVMESLANRL